MRRGSPATRNKSGVMDHDHLAVERKLHVEFDAIASLAGGGERGQRVFETIGPVISALP